MSKIAKLRTTDNVTLYPSTTGQAVTVRDTHGSTARLVSLDALINDKVTVTDRGDSVTPIHIDAKGNTKACSGVIVTDKPQSFAGSKTFSSDVTVDGKLHARADEASLVADSAKPSTLIGMSAVPTAMIPYEIAFWNGNEIRKTSYNNLPMTSEVSEEISRRALISDTAEIGDNLNPVYLVHDPSTNDYVIRKTQGVIVTSGTQTFSGNKTFNGTLDAGDTTLSSLQVKGDMHADGDIRTSSDLCIKGARISFDSSTGVLTLATP